MTLIIIRSKYNNNNNMTSDEVLYVWLHRGCLLRIGAIEDTAGPAPIILYIFGIYLHPPPMTQITTAVIQNIS